MDLDPRAAAVSEAAAQAAAAMAHFVELAAGYAAHPEAWAGGWRSFEHWLTNEAGLEYRSASDVCRIGAILPSLPGIATAFREGRLSFDKVRLVTRLATAEDEHVWLEMATGCSAAQLGRLVRGIEQARRLENADEERERHRRRGLWVYTAESSLVHLHAVLTSDEAAVVLAALEAAARPAYEPGIAPAYDLTAARRVDALVDICERSPLERPNTPSVVVHVDIGVLTGEEPEGRCETEDGRRLSRAAAIRLGCDAQLVAILEKDGVPLDVGRARRTESPALRRARTARDRTCIFPGCGVKARSCDGHHLLHWVLGGRTALDNDASLCGFHHRAHHRGDFEIVTGGGGRFEFLDRSGRELGPTRRPPVRLKRHRTTGTPAGTWGGEEWESRDYAVSVVIDELDRIRAPGKL